MMVGLVFRCLCVLFHRLLFIVVVFYVNRLSSVQCRIPVLFVL